MPQSRKKIFSYTAVYRNQPVMPAAPVSFKDLFGNGTSGTVNRPPVISIVNPPPPPRQAAAKVKTPVKQPRKAVLPPKTAITRKGGTPQNAPIVRARSAGDVQIPWWDWIPNFFRHDAGNYPSLKETPTAIAPRAVPPDTTISVKQPLDLETELLRVTPEAAKALYYAFGRGRDQIWQSIDVIGNDPDALANDIQHTQDYFPASRSFQDFQQQRGGLRYLTHPMAVEEMLATGTAANAPAIPATVLATMVGGPWAGRSVSGAYLGTQSGIQEYIAFMQRYAGILQQQNPHLSVEAAFQRALKDPHAQVVARKRGYLKGGINGAIGFAGMGAGGAAENAIASPVLGKTADLLITSGVFTGGEVASQVALDKHITDPNAVMDAAVLNLPLGVTHMLLGKTGATERTAGTPNNEGLSAPIPPPKSSRGSTVHTGTPPPYDGRYDTPEVIRLRNLQQTETPTDQLQTPEREAMRSQVADTLYGAGASVKRRQAVIVLGPPAAGKSGSMVNPLAEATGSLVIDSDAVKEHLPEYDGGEKAGVVHLESANIAMKRILPHAIKNGDNIIIPMVGQGSGLVSGMISSLKDSGYDVHLRYMDVSPYESAHRALNRYNRDQRFVDPKYAYDASFNSRKTYDILKQDRRITSYAEYSNNVPEGQPPNFVNGKALPGEREAIRRGGRRDTGGKP